jgi:uncharacterized protein YabE (DUF348 family)
MTVTGSPPVKRVKDKTLPKGKTVVEEEGSSPSRTSVTRTIYGKDGERLRTETWNTSYRGETKLVRVGTKTKKPPKTDPTAPGTSPKPPSEEDATPTSTRP